MRTPIRNGVLVAFEGIDGSGKTTQASMLHDWADGLGFEVVSTKEPTAGTWGKRIRESKFTHRLAPDAELECFVNDRREHVESLILPALKRGALVIVDRYYYSTVAYQGARGLEPRAVLEINRAFAPIPDLVFLLDLDPKTGLERISKRGAGQDLFETLEELTKARKIFKWLSETDRHVLTLDARLSIEEVHQSVIFEVVRGPMFERMGELGDRLKIPTEAPDYELLRVAEELAHDATIPIQEKVRRLWHHANAKGRKN
jgi:dTMP kinase